MELNNSFYIFIPCYNEEENITPLLENIKKLKQLCSGAKIDIKTIVVDDFSSDKSREVVKKYISDNEFVSIHEHSENRGLAGVLDTFLKEGQKFVNNKDVLGIGLLDGDNTHNPLTFFPMLSKIHEGFDVVVASRYQTGSHVMGVSKIRLLLSFGMSLLFRAFGRIENIRDYSCGFRAYSRDIIKRVGPQKMKFRSFACMVELLTLCEKAGATFHEVPFCLRYDYKKGASKMKFFKTIFDTIKVLTLR